MKGSFLPLQFLSLKRATVCEIENWLGESIGTQVFSNLNWSIHWFIFIFRNSSWAKYNYQEMDHVHDLKCLLDLEYNCNICSQDLGIFNFIFSFHHFDGATVGSIHSQWAIIQFFYLNLMNTLLGRTFVVCVKICPWSSFLIPVIE